MDWCCSIRLWKDRLSYQSYDLLFNPELKIQPIPLESSYIQHIQGVYSLFDYLASNYTVKILASITIILIQIFGEICQCLQTKKQEQKGMKKIKDCLIKIISDEEELEQFKLHLINSLSISDEELEAVLWEHPRPLLTTVIPTAIRRLETNWGLNINSKEDHMDNSLLPEFIPSTLFGELNLPEVELILPRLNDEKDEEYRDRSKKMPILQALNAFAPGKFQEDLEMKCQVTDIGSF